MSAYDPSNVFARILRGELPCEKVYEDQFALAFPDINPLAPVHVLVIPKGEYISNDDFSANAPAELIAGFWRAVGEVARRLGLDAKGYRLVANHGPNGGQLVFHFHVHIFGGTVMSHQMGKMPRPAGNA
jgi:diadenosine tetraphosphate (Ap4A) HIT family hydrolase